MPTCDSDFVKPDWSGANSSALRKQRSRRWTSMRASDADKRSLAYLLNRVDWDDDVETTPMYKRSIHGALTYSLTIVLLVSVLWCSLASAQNGDLENSALPKIPRLVKFNGVLRDAVGQPRTGTLGMTFAVYTDATGGQRLWQETQNIQVDEQGHYEAILGASSDGVPAELFASGDPRWLGVQVQLPGEDEQARVLLVSVPYALKAADADKLGGLPASAFVRASNIPAPNAIPTDSTVATPAVPALPAIRSNTPNQDAIALGARVNSIPKFSGNGSLVNSQITASNGVVGMRNLGNILFAESFAGGVPAAIDACPKTGCIVYALSTQVNRNLGHIDPGTKALTLYLGPYTFNVK